MPCLLQRQPACLLLPSLCISCFSDKRQLKSEEFILTPHSSVEYSPSQSRKTWRQEHRQEVDGLLGCLSELNGLLILVSALGGEAKSLPPQYHCKDSLNLLFPIVSKLTGSIPSDVCQLKECISVLFMFTRRVSEDAQFHEDILLWLQRLVSEQIHAEKLFIARVI